MSGPLAGVRVLDFSSAVTGPFCTMLMGDLGQTLSRLKLPVAISCAITI